VVRTPSMSGGIETTARGRRARRAPVLTVAAASAALVGCSSAGATMAASDAGDGGPGGPLDGASGAVDAGAPRGNGSAVEAGADAGTDAGSSCVPRVPGEACGLDPQCGCASTQTCDFNGEAAGCVLAGTAPAGHACTVTQACARGLSCFNGACRPFCASGGEVACAALDGGGDCFQVEADDGGLIRGYDLCSFRCALNDPGACGPTGDLYAGCVPDGMGGTDCALVGFVDEGGDCSTSECKPGLACVTGEGGAPACSRWCRVGLAQGSDCGDGGNCQAFSQSVVANGTEYGICP